MQTRKDILEIDRESVIVISKSKLIDGLLNLIGPDERVEFKILCRRIESTIRAWYNLKFEEMNQLYSLFDPVHGRKKLESLHLSPAKVDKMEQRFLKTLFQVMEQSNFQILSDAEVELANAGQYLVNMPIAVNKSKLDKKLLTTFFKENKVDQVPSYADQYVIFRRGIGIDKTTDYFILPKLDLLIERTWNWFLEKLGFSKVKNEQLVHVHSLSRKRVEDQNTLQGNTQNEDKDSGADAHNLRFERIRIQNMDISFQNLFTQNTVQEPTFDRMIVVYRRASKPHHIIDPLGDRAIHIRHFRNIPLADMELVLPEKKNPGLTPMDWVKLLISALVGLVALFGSTEVGEGDVWVLLAILGGIVGYIVKIYFTFQANLVLYQNLITQSLYDKQLDSGRGTILHLCDDVIQQEVKEVIMAYFVLMSQGKATDQELDRRCEELMTTKFGEKCDFDVHDALVKLEKLDIITKDVNGRYSHQPLKKANNAIGQTTDEKVEMTIGR